MYLKKQDLSSLNWKQIQSLTDVELEEFAQQHLRPHQQWFLPQLVAQFGMWSIVYSENKIDILNTLKQNCQSDPKQQGLWRLTRIQRSALIKSQTQFADYGALTPLVLAGFKQYQGVEYEQFRDLEGLEWLVEPRLLEAIVVDCVSLGSDRLLEIRNQGLMNKTGAKAGELKPAETTWSLTGIRDTELGHLPKLTQTMLTQIWLAHPAKRTNLMILDPNNWDRMPKPLVEELFTSTQQAVAEFKPKQNTLPWL